MNTASHTNRPGSTWWLALAYAIILTADQIFIIWNFDTGRYVSKSLLMPVLLGYFWVNARTIHSGSRALIAMALLASWAGDVLLLFEARDGIFFLAGLGSFLLAHIFYCIYFERIRRKIGPPLQLWLALPVVLYYGVLIYVLSPRLGELTWPVRIYGAVISIMLFLALQVHWTHRNRASFLMALGAAFFVISDSLLAVNKFYAPFPFAGVTIMCTYGIAQLFIVTGVLLYELESGNQK